MTIKPEFKKRLIKGYQDDLRWRKLLSQIQVNNILKENTTKLPY